MIPAWHQLVPISGHVEESETARKLQLYATSIKTSVSTRLLYEFHMCNFPNQCKVANLSRYAVVPVGEVAGYPYPEWHSNGLM